MGFIEFKNITKKYDDVTVLDNLSLTMEQGELITLLGPSGCGKSTLLRCLAGLEEINGGSIIIDGKDVTNLPPQKRGIGMVFQQYSLFPNMTVYENIAFGLKLAKVDTKTIKEKVTEVIELVDLVGREKRYPDQLSGGQQQRVALARSIVHEPKVLLLDEPLSAIDAKLRKSLQNRIKRIQKKLKITTVFVTHDQDEAMIMSDTIHLFNTGRIEQSANPIEMYTSPKTKFAAEFIGHYNILENVVAKKIFNDDFSTNYVAIRPETFSLSETLDALDPTDHYIFKGIVKENLVHGNVLRYTITVEGVDIHCDVLFRSFQLYDTKQDIYVSVSKHNVLDICDEATI